MLYNMCVFILQAGEEKYRNAWAKICEISRTGYQKLYQRLGVHLEEKVMRGFSILSWSIIFW